MIFKNWNRCLDNQKCPGKNLMTAYLKYHLKGKYLRFHITLNTSNQFLFFYNFSTVFLNRSQIIFFRLCPVCYHILCTQHRACSKWKFIEWMNNYCIELEVGNDCFSVLWVEFYLVFSFHLNIGQVVGKESNFFPWIILIAVSYRLRTF